MKKLFLSLLTLLVLVTSCKKDDIVAQPKPSHPPVRSGYTWNWSPLVNDNGTLNEPLTNVTISFGQYTAYGYGDNYGSFEEVGYAVANALSDDHQEPLGFGSSNLVFGTVDQGYGDFILVFNETGDTLTIPME